MAETRDSWGESASKKPDGPKPRPASSKPADPEGWIEPREGTVNDHSFIDLQQRLAEAERLMRSTRWLAAIISGIACLVAIGGLALLATRPGQAFGEGSVLKAPFSVVDEQGQVLLHMGLDKDGPQLRLSRPSGDLIGSLGATEEGGSLIVAGGASGTSATLLTNPLGGQLTLSDNTARPAASLGARERGGSLTFWEKSGHDVLSAGAGEQGGEVTLTGHGGTVRTLSAAQADPSVARSSPRSGGGATPASHRIAAHPGTSIWSSRVRSRHHGSKRQYPPPANPVEHPHPALADRPPVQSPHPVEADAPRSPAPAPMQTHAPRSPAPAPIQTQAPRSPAPAPTHSRTANRAARLRIARRQCDTARDYQLLGNYSQAENGYRSALATYKQLQGTHAADHSPYLHRRIRTVLDDLATLHRQQARAIRRSGAAPPIGTGDLPEAAQPGQSQPPRVSRHRATRWAPKRRQGRALPLSRAVHSLPAMP